MWQPRIIRASRHYPWAKGGAGVGAALVTWLLTSVGAPGPLGWVAFAAVTYFCLVTAYWVQQWLLPAIGTNALINRRDDATQHAGGVASALDIAEHAGPWAMRSRAATLRPSLRGTSRRELAAVPLTQYAVPLVKAGWLPWGNTVHASCEEVTLRIGGPRTGKTGSLACHALDAPGALILTTTRTDLLDITRDVRSARGRVDVFNPTGLGGLASSVRWSPLIGCKDLGTARRRASDLIPPSSGDAERWDAQARGLLAVLMHAAAMVDGTMAKVLDWISPADEVARDQVLGALLDSPSGQTLSSEVRSIYGTNERTLTSITATMLPALRWVTDSTASLVGDAELDDPRFLDVPSLVADGRDSLYLIGRTGSVRPLLSALTSEIAHQARMVAAAQPAGRLDPPLTMVLDEAPMTCGPIPLPDWTSDMGGRGVTIHIAAQSLAQIRDVWGKERGSAILGNVAALLVFGGLKNTDDLSDISGLCGQRLMQLDPDDRRMVQVMTAAQIAALPPGQCLVLKNALRPIVGRAPMAWDRPQPRTPRPEPATVPVPRARLVDTTAGDLA